MSRPQLERRHPARPAGSSEPQSCGITRGLHANRSFETKKLWDKATRRDFNLGIQSGAKPFAFELDIPSDLLAAVAGLQGRIVVTVYAAQPEGSHGQRRRRTSR